jgi:uncharacterized membrane protein YoaK (UPF0700 family)
LYNNQRATMASSTTGSSYGTITSGKNGQLHEPADEENSPLLQRPSGSTRTAFLKRLKAYLTKDIDTKHGDLILLSCYTITGFLDSSSITIWSSFVSMQTGNTVYIGLGLADPYANTRWIKAATSLGCFCFGSFMFSRYHQFFSPRKRWVLISAHLLQTFFIITAAIIVTHDSPSERTIRWQTILPIALLSFQAAGQAVTSRALKFNALTSVVLTSIYCDLFSDVNLFAKIADNVERNQRASAPFALILGVIAGALLGKTEFGMPTALWTAVALKLLIVVAWFFWRPMKQEEEEES